MPTYKTLDEVPRALSMALATTSALSWIGFDLEDVFTAFGLPHPQNAEKCPPDHRWITVHLRTQDKEFVVDCGSMPVAEVDELSWPSACEVWQPLDQEARLAFRMRWLDDLMLALMMSAIQERGIRIPVLDNDPSVNTGLN